MFCKFEYLISDNDNLTYIYASAKQAIDESLYECWWSDIDINVFKS